jgi:hypothetical protein
MGTPMTVYEAREYASCAAGCGHRIEPGHDIIHALDEQVMHLDCADDLRGYQADDTPVCGDCWQIHDGNCPPL